MEKLLEGAPANQLPESSQKLVPSLVQVLSAARHKEEGKRRKEDNRSPLAKNRPDKDFLFMVFSYGCQLFSPAAAGNHKPRGMSRRKTDQTKDRAHLSTATGYSL
jgi:hypothetical protein